MGRFSGPPINRAARGGVDPIPLSSSSRYSHFPHHRFPAILRPPRSRACAPIQPPAPADHVLALPPCIVLLLRMCIKTLCTIRSIANPSGGMEAEAASIPDPRGVGPVDDDRGQNPSLGEPRAAPTIG
jgi:hypothetical protein